MLQNHSPSLSFNIAEDREIFPAASGFYIRHVKRAVDVVGSIFLLTLCVPFLPFVALLLKLDSKGPVFFHQNRGGLNGKTIRVHKFRTLYTHLCDEGQNQITHKDKRVTRFGHYLRCTSIDELPQLWNVLKGDMSLIGPRPHAVPMDEYYAPYIPSYYARYNAKPGMSGWAQIHDRRGETKLIMDMASRVAYDLDYIQRQSFRMDVEIFIRTIGVLLKCKC